MRTVAKIQAEIEQVQAQIAQLEADIANTPDTEGPEWEIARRNYINTGDMSGINNFYNRRDQLARDKHNQEMEQKRFALEQSRLANEMAEAGKASTEEAETAEDNVRLAAIKYQQAKGSILEDEAKLNYEIAQRAYTKTHGGKMWSPASTGNETQTPERQIDTIIANKYESGKISAADRTKAISDLTRLMGQVDADSETWQKANSELMRIRGLKTAEMIAGKIKQLKDEKASIPRQVLLQSKEQKKRLAEIDAELKKLGAK